MTRGGREGSRPRRQRRTTTADDNGGRQRRTRLGAIAAFLIAGNGGNDDPEGIGVSGQQCPDYAGAEGEDETPEIASDPSPFFGCQVAVAAPVAQMLGPDAARLENGIVIVRSDGATTWNVAEGQTVGVTATMKEKLDSNDAALASVKPALHRRRRGRAPDEVAAHRSRLGPVTLC